MQKVFGVKVDDDADDTEDGANTANDTEEWEARVIGMVQEIGGDKDRLIALLINALVRRSASPDGGVAHFHGHGNFYFAGVVNNYYYAAHPPPPTSASPERSEPDEDGQE